MTLTIENIKDDEHFECKGDVRITGSIGKNATVIIKDGSLIVDGNVGTGSDVTLKTEKSSGIVISSGSFFMSSSSVVIGGGAAGSSLHVKGNVDSRVKITTSSADITVDGVINSGAKFNTQSGDITAIEVKGNVSFKTMSGNIRATNVGADSSLNTMSGDIHARTIDAGTTLQTMSGDIHAGSVGARATVKTMSGDISVDSAHESALIDSMSGDIRVAGVRRRKEAVGGFGSVTVSSVGGMAFIGGGRIVVDGRDITALVRGAATGAGDASATEAPIRYTKS